MAPRLLRRLCLRMRGMLARCYAAVRLDGEVRSLMAFALYSWRPQLRLIVLSMAAMVFATVLSIYIPLSAKEVIMYNGDTSNNIVGNNNSSYLDALDGSQRGGGVVVDSAAMATAAHVVMAVSTPPPTTTPPPGNTVVDLTGGITGGVGTISEFLFLRFLPEALVPGSATERVSFAQGLVCRCLFMALVVVLYHGISLAAHLSAYRAGVATQMSMVQRSLACILATAHPERITIVNPVKLGQLVFTSASTSSQTLSVMLTDVVSSVFSAVGMLVALLYISTTLTALIAGLVVVVQYVYFLSGRREHYKGAAVTREETSAQAYLANAFARCETIFVFHCHSFVLTRFGRKLDGLAALINSLNVSIHGHAAVSSSVTTLIFVVVLGLCNHYHRQGKLAMTDIVLYFLFLHQFVNRLLQLSKDLSQTRATLGRLHILKSMLEWYMEPHERYDDGVAGGGAAAAMVVTGGCYTTHFHKRHGSGNSNSSSGSHCLYSPLYHPTPYNNNNNNSKQQQQQQLVFQTRAGSTLPYKDDDSHYHHQGNNNNNNNNSIVAAAHDGTHSVGNISVDTSSSSLGSRSCATTAPTTAMTTTTAATTTATTATSAQTAPVLSVPLLSGSGGSNNNNNNNSVVATAATTLPSSSSSRARRPLGAIACTTHKPQLREGATAADDAVGCGSSHHTSTPASALSATRRSGGGGGVQRAATNNNNNSSRANDDSEESDAAGAPQVPVVLPSAALSSSSQPTRPMLKRRLHTAMTLSPSVLLWPPPPHVHVCDDAGALVALDCVSFTYPAVPWFFSDDTTAPHKSKQQQQQQSQHHRHGSDSTEESAHNGRSSSGGSGVVVVIGDEANATAAATTSSAGDAVVTASGVVPARDVVAMAELTPPSLMTAPPSIIPALPTFDSPHALLTSLQQQQQQQPPYAQPSSYSGHRGDEAAHVHASMPHNNNNNNGNNSVTSAYSATAATALPPLARSPPALPRSVPGIAQRQSPPLQQQQQALQPQQPPSPHAPQRGGVRNVTLSAESGKITALFGASGCGKSTCLRLFSGLVKPQSGTVHTHRRVVLLEQSHAIFIGTVAENILLQDLHLPDMDWRYTAASPATATAATTAATTTTVAGAAMTTAGNGATTTQTSPHVDGATTSLTMAAAAAASTSRNHIISSSNSSSMMPYVSPAIRQRVQQAVVKSGCASFLRDPFRAVIENVDHPPFSGGQLQRICLARVFGVREECTLVLLDEPTTGLDPESVQQLLQTIRELRDVYHKTVLISTHDSRVAEIADHVIEMQSAM